MTLKVAFVGPPQIHESFMAQKDDWDLQTPMTSLSAFSNDLDTDEPNNKIDKNTSVIIMFSRLFNNNPTEFAELAAFLAPYSVICILIPNSDKQTYQKKIEVEISKQKSLLANQDEEYNFNSPVFFVTYENVFDEVDKAINDFYNSPVIEDEYKEALKIYYSSDDDLDSLFTDEEEQQSTPIIQNTNGNGRVISVTSSKGGSGKSTVSMSIANSVSLASLNAFKNNEIEKPAKVCIIDFDVRDGQLGFINGVPGPTIVNIYVDYNPNEPLTEEMVKQGVYHNPHTEVDVILASRKPRNANEISLDFYKNLVFKLKEMYDYVFIDTSVSYLDDLLSDVAYPLSDKIIFVTDMGASSVYGMTRWVNEILNSPDKESPINIENVGVVINKAVKDSGMEMNTIVESARGVQILTVIPNAPTLVTRATNDSRIERILDYPPINEAFDILLDFVLKEDEVVGEIKTTD